MKTAHLIIVSAQPIPNLIPILSGKPETVHLLVSDKMERQAIRLIRFLEQLDICCIRHSIAAYDMGQVESVCNEILADAPIESITLNATGGTKVAAFGAFAAFRQQGFPIVYFDPILWQIISLYGIETPPQKADAELSVADYLATHGMRVIEAQEYDEESNQRKELSAWLAEHLPDSGVMPVLNGFAAEAQKKRTFPATFKFDKRYSYSFTTVLKKLHKENIITWNEKERSITFKNIDFARYIGGFWLEEHIYYIVKSLRVHDVRRNVKVAWDSSGITNEFDVVFTNCCRLFLISCKTSKLGQQKLYKDKNPVYELDSLKDEAAGLFGEGILVSASPLGQELQKRADTLKLITISSKDAGKWLKVKLGIALR